MAAKMSKSKLNDKITRYQELQEEIDRLSAEAEMLKDEIKAYMGEEEEINTGKFIIRWTKCSSSRFDSTSFKKAHPRMYENFIVNSEYRRFSVK